MVSGNFVVGPFAALFVLFLANARALLYEPPGRWRSLVAWCAFWMHCASGVLYLAHLQVSTWAVP